MGKGPGTQRACTNHSRDLTQGSPITTYSLHIQLPMHARSLPMHAMCTTTKRNKNMACEKDCRNREHFCMWEDPTLYKKRMLTRFTALNVCEQCLKSAPSMLEKRAGNAPPHTLCGSPINRRGGLYQQTRHLVHSFMGIVADPLTTSDQ